MVVTIYNNTSPWVVTNLLTILNTPVNDGLDFDRLKTLCALDLFWEHRSLKPGTLPWFCCDIGNHITWQSLDFHFHLVNQMWRTTWKTFNVFYVLQRKPGSLTAQTNLLELIVKCLKCLEYNFSNTENHQNHKFTSRCGCYLNVLCTHHHPIHYCKFIIKLKQHFE